MRPLGRERRRHHRGLLGGAGPCARLGLRAEARSNANRLRRAPDRLTIQSPVVAIGASAFASPPTVHRSSCSTLGPYAHESTLVTVPPCTKKVSPVNGHPSVDR